ncbi:hypothetical protein PH213_36060 [Streptomyces sp. SRF1]|uniref:hypothetical protein n=1 Tax=Streptomyces sp. SRF1 TaxID=1549642 RepID=UPI0025B12653|nr:hypothetical protein [Streptomyces sp. SRF1]MDN3059846.1 hypothetical protein [Streptomyces sp. SRF1]
MPELLVDVAERIVVPVTVLPDAEAGEWCEDTFALEALGRVFVTALRTWAQGCRTRLTVSPARSSTSPSDLPTGRRPSPNATPRT